MLFSSIPIAAGAIPSPNTLQWSDDGQLLLITKTALHILTPDLGITFDSSNKINAIPPTEPSQSPSTTISWYRTLIGLPTLNHTWTTEPEGHAGLVLGSLDLSWRAASWSPSNLSPTGTCLLAALTTNLELSLWAPSTNQLKGEWQQLENLTQSSIDTIENIEDSQINKQEGDTCHTLQSQVLSISWSKQANFSHVDLDASLLAVASKTGVVSFMRYNVLAASMQVMDSIFIGDGWVCQLAWSKWHVVDPGVCEAYLACGLPDGSIRLISVTQSLRGDSNEAPYALHLETHILDEQSPALLDFRYISSLSWIRTSLGEDILVHAKPGSVGVWSRSTGLQITSLKRQQVCTGSSHVLPPAGFFYNSSMDSLFVVLSDTSLHTIYSISSSPSLLPQHEKSIPAHSSLSLSKAMWTACQTVEGRTLSQQDLIQAYGATNFDSLGSTTWIYESWKPQDFDHRPSAKHRSMLLVKQLWTDPHEEAALYDQIFLALNTGGFGLNEATISTLRFAFLGLRQPNKFSKLRDRLLSLLGTDLGDPRDLPPLPYNLREIGDSNSPSECRKVLREHYLIHLSTFEPMRQLRLKYSLASFCSTLYKDTGYEECSSMLINNIHYYQLHVILAALIHFKEALKGSGKMFSTAIIEQARLHPHSDSHILLPASELEAHLATHAGGGMVDAQEHCPACGVPISRNSSTSAECSNGHVWARCSITTQVLSTSKSRSCIGCSRKAFLPPSQAGAYHAQQYYDSWFVEEILEATRRCLVCGNSYTRIL